MNTSHRTPHHHGADEGAPEPGGMPVEPDDGAPIPGMPTEPEPGGDPAPEV
ncbi:hypothetical protein [Pseudorhodoferax sp. Leaf267]|uniref:hypothetical protein n=1 Tax=Pseudorhodoferax sp. Leaf267 TaxID=1736316 RepID=UPI0012E150D4|nr:hypothetical protein [Pseudorhodoferax sp. Leaf267]